MGLVTTALISFVVIAVNLGFSQNFARQWLRSWGLAYAIVIPAILMIGPRVQAAMERVIR